ncbi:MAG: TOBE domain-containing protein [Thermodesulfobacteriota bacterium]
MKKTGPRSCGFAKRRGGPEAIRKAQAVEWIQGDMPLPAVQMILGHSTPNLTSSYVSFSKEEIQLLAKRFMEKESARKSSARNRFFCKIENILRGDIQTRVEMTSIDGHSISTVITNDSLERLDLHPGRLITAEVKAPWVLLQGGGAIPVCSAENRLQGVLIQITRGEINTEYVVRISDATEVCAIVMHSVQAD